MKLSQKSSVLLRKVVVIYTGNHSSFSLTRSNFPFTSESIEESIQLHCELFKSVDCPPYRLVLWKREGWQSPVNISYGSFMVSGRVGSRESIVYLILDEAAYSTAVVWEM